MGVLVDIRFFLALLEMEFTPKILLYEKREVK